MVTSTKIIPNQSQYLNRELMNEICLNEQGAATLAADEMEFKRGALYPLNDWINISKWVNESAHTLAKLSNLLKTKTNWTNFLNLIRVINGRFIKEKAFRLNNKCNHLHLWIIYIKWKRTHSCKHNSLTRRLLNKLCCKNINMPLCSTTHSGSQVFLFLNLLRIIEEELKWFFFVIRKPMNAQSHCIFKEQQ